MNALVLSTNEWTFMQVIIALVAQAYAQVPLELAADQIAQNEHRC